MDASFATRVATFLADGLAPELVWGLVPRLMGVLYAIVFASLAPQVLGLAGKHGISPAHERLTRMREDYPGPGRFFRMPTLLWVDSSDRTLRALPWLGMACAGIAIYGGSAGPWALVACWALYLSLDVCGLWYPWDCFVLESGFLALMLPAVPGLDEGVGASVLPYPALAFMWRMLMLRLMLGFAKLKFIGSRRGDDLYLRGFFVWMPICNRLGWYAQHAPRWALRAKYGLMGIIEIVFPLLGFFTGTPRVLSGVGLLALMAGIWATGNFGFFNVGYGLLCVILFDAHSSLADIPSWASLWATPHAALTHVVLGVLAFGSLFYFVFNSWCSQTWIHWPYDSVTFGRPLLRGLLGFYRALAPFRVINSYGVFPPNAGPPFKIVPVFQGSDDGEHWHDFEYKFIACQEHSRPKVVAPHHPRVDHGIIYVGSGMSDADYLSSIVWEGKNYGFSPFSHWSWAHRLAQRLLEGRPEVRALFAKNTPFSERPPQYVRLATFLLTPTSLSERKETGKWWQRRLVNVIVRATRRDPLVWKHWLPPPECFHPDALPARRSSPALKAMLEAFARGEPHRQAVRVHSPLTEQDVHDFWSEVIPFLQSNDRHDWSQLEATIGALEERYGRERMLTFERILERYTFLLRTRLEPHFFGNASPRIEKRSNFRFHMLMHEIILDGEAAFERTAASPALATQRTEPQTLRSELFMAAIFRHETLRFHSATMRLMQRFTNAFDRPLPGVYEFAELLRATPPSEEYWLPTCELQPNGEWYMGDFGVPVERQLSPTAALRDA